MKKLFGLLLGASLLFSCNNESCSDGVQNQDETDIDCGGVCTACPSCSDGILNQNETDIDCGGTCTPCPYLEYPEYGQSGQQSALYPSYLQYTSGGTEEFKVRCFNGATVAVKWITNNGGTGPVMGFQYGWSQVESDYNAYNWFICETDSCDCEFFMPPSGTSTVYVYENFSDTAGSPTWQKTITH